MSGVQPTNFPSIKTLDGGKTINLRKPCLACDISEDGESTF